jgi:dynein heavy chain
VQEIRIKESGMDSEMEPIMNMYHMLEHFLPPGFMEKEEIDKKTVLITYMRIDRLKLSSISRLSTHTYIHTNR